MFWRKYEMVFSGKTGPTTSMLCDFHFNFNLFIEEH